MPTDDFVIGRTAASPTTPCLINCFAFSGHALDEIDADDIWRGGSPQLFQPLNSSNLSRGGNLTGAFLGVEDQQTGCSFILSVGPNTQPFNNVSGPVIGSNPGDPIRTRSLVGFNARTALAENHVLSEIMVQAHAELADASVGAHVCRVVNVHDSTQSWGDFFDRQMTDSLGGRATYVAQVAPRTRQLAAMEPGAATFMLIGANSRATRTVTFPAQDDVESYVGGALRYFEPVLIGVNNVPLGVNSNRYRYFRESPSSEFFTSGTVRTINDSTHPDQSFARWWSGTPGGQTNASGAGYLLASDAAVLSIKAKPEPNTRFHSAEQPIRFRAFLLRFPGGGDVTWEAVEGLTITTYGTPIPAKFGSLSTDAPDTIIHAMSGTDQYVAAPAIHLDGDLVALVGERDAVYVSNGAGKGGLATIASVSYNGTSTIISLQHALPGSPSVAGQSVLKFGTAGVIVFDHDFEPLGAGGPYRGVAFTAPSGETEPVAIMAAGAWATDVPGVIVGPFGRPGAGWNPQLLNNSSVGLRNMLEALSPDVFFQFFAQQGSQPSSMAAFAEVFRAACPDTEHWWVGDPQHTSGPYFDWDAYILDESPNFDIGAVTAVDDPHIGNIWEQCAQGHRSGGVHHSDDGAQKYVERVCELLKTAALPFHADFDGDGDIDANDRLLLCAAMGSSRGDSRYDEQFDLNNDRVVDYLDLGMFDSAFPPSCAADLVSAATFQPPPDGFVDAADLAYLLGKWTSPPSCADLVSSDTFLPPPDGAVDAADLAVLLGAWGPCN